MPRPNKTGITPALYNEYRNKTNPTTGKAYTDSDIASELGCTKQNISDMKRRYKNLISQTKEESVREEAWPWGRLENKYHQTETAHRLSDHLKFMANDGKGMSEYRLKALRRFYRFLRETRSVVEFHPDIEPNRHSSVGGFAYRDRVETDDDLILRLNELTESLTDDALDYWTFPRRDP